MPDSRGHHITKTSGHTWVFCGHLFLDFPVSSKNSAHFIQKRSIRKKTLNWNVVLVRVRTFPLISRRFPLISRRFPLIFRDKSCQVKISAHFCFSAQNLKRSKRMPRAPKSDQLEDPGISHGHGLIIDCKGIWVAAWVCQAAKPRSAEAQ